MVYIDEVTRGMPRLLSNVTLASASGSRSNFRLDRIAGQAREILNACSRWSEEKLDLPAEALLLEQEQRCSEIIDSDAEAGSNTKCGNLSRPSPGAAVTPKSTCIRRAWRSTS